MEPWGFVCGKRFLYKKKELEIKNNIPDTKRRVILYLGYIFLRIEKISLLYQYLDLILRLSVMSAINSEFVGFPFLNSMVYPKISSMIAVFPLPHATSMA